MAVGIVVLAIAGGYVILAGGKETPPDATAPASRTEPPPGIREAATAVVDESRPDGLADRVVGANLVAVPDVNPSELERLPPRESLSQSSDQKDGAHSGTRLLHRPVAIAAGLLEAEEHLIRLAGIDPLLPDTICGISPGNAVPCGKQALTAFRAWLRGRSIECVLSAPDADGVVVAPCRLAGKDAASWLVQQGWARAQAGTRYADLETVARKNKRGIFSRSE